MKTYTVSEFAKLINKSRQTLLRWDQQGVFKPNGRNTKNHRVYTHDQFVGYLKEKFGVEIKTNIKGEN